VHGECISWYTLTPMVLYVSKDRRTVHQHSQIRLLKLSNINYKPYRD